MAKRVCVLLGGWGEEREISLKTGEAAIAALRSFGHHVTRVVAGPGLDRALRTARPDVVFMALHGRMGEDGRVQGLLEVRGVPYTGSGVLASALAMNKPFAKQLFRQHNVPTPVGYTVTGAHLSSVHARHADLGFPCVVKPACGGSSLGLSIVRAREELIPACARALPFGGVAMVERYIPGREVTVAVLSDVVLGSCEVVFEGEGFDFAHKYGGESQYHLPPRLSLTRVKNVEALALGAYRALGCRGAARVDLRVSEEDNDAVLEVNTLPGLTAQSLLPRIAARAGLPFPDLVERILSLATLDEASRPQLRAVESPEPHDRAAG